MKIQLIILLFLMISPFYSANYSFLIIPAVSSARLPIDSASTTGLSVPDPVSVKNYPNNITIIGNLNLTGNSVVNFAGVSSSTPVKVYLNGSIFINDNATLVLRHAKLYFMGATKPYGRNITLSSSNGHPQLLITDASIIAITGVTSRLSGNSYSYAAAIYAYNESKVVATQFTLSRQTISTFLGSNYGGLTEIGCYGKSSVFLNGVTVESMFTYDEANVTAYDVTVTHSLGLYNSSVANFYGVSFPNTVVAGNVHLVLAHCSEQASSMITSTGHSRVDLINGTAVAAFTTISSGIVTTVPGINATGDSEVYFFSSTTSSRYGGPVVTVYDNATFVEQASTMNDAAVFAFDNSSVLFNNTLTTGSLQNVEIIGSDSSSVSIFTCDLSSSPNPIAINLFDSSHLHVVNSTISGGYLVFSDNSTTYLSGTSAASSRIIAQNNANLTVEGGSTIQDSIEMRGNARLSLESSTASLIYCPDSSYASFVHGSVSGLLLVGENSTVRLMNSTIQELSLAESNVTGSLSGLTSFIENSTLTLPGSRSDVSVLDTTVNGLDFSFSGNSNVTISNSTLRNLNLQGSSIVTLKNASVYAGLSVHGNSTVALYSTLRVRCVDYFGNPLNSSVITVDTHAGGIGGSQTETADKNGWASFIFFTGIVNATGSFLLGLATVTGNFGDVSESETFNVASVGKEMTLSLPLPWWSGYILPVIILVAIVALLAFINYAYQRVRARK